MHRPTLLAALLLATLGLAAGAALSHYSWRDVHLSHLSEDGSVGLFVVSQGDTEGGASGETWLLLRLDAAVSPAATVALGLDGDLPSLLASVEVLPYHPSPGTSMSHTPAERSAAPVRRERFTQEEANTRGVTVEAAGRLVPREPGGGWKLDDGRSVAVTEQPDGKAALSLSGSTKLLTPRWEQNRTCVEAIYRTSSSHSFVVKSFDHEDGGSCPTDLRDRYGPPPERTFVRISFEKGG